ncbi:PREDICTED: translation initiation factor IF-2, mitochondrial-like isoform X2 [Priapulus caudatus]|uniref:Translation initiation factor IF-2, mitochondrial-like isoform X2 n=1 Tax=Priapulus caudatus TaxID=37621 RepID=A0ABM1ERZ9_PRICU|nr:PREDICTED: translation initiation factor IF-2, mitochondrial-like isoform X2 [Priapulus caudatus]
MSPFSMWKTCSDVGRHLLKEVYNHGPCGLRISLPSTLTVRGCSVCKRLHITHQRVLHADLRFVSSLHTSSFLSSNEKTSSKKKAGTDDDILEHKIRDPFNYPKKSKKLAPKITSGMVTVHQNMTVSQLAETIGKSLDHVYEAMMYITRFNTNHYDKPEAVIDNIRVIQEIVEKTGLRYKIKADPRKQKEAVDLDAYRSPVVTDPALLKHRPPVVTIMGHVDHGKTTLLDALRSTNVVATEFGGITQHVSAFSVELPESKQRITFLDTPGHAAFSSMRSRGAHVTDIVVLVVAADDGVMEQTIESIKYAKNAGVAVIVAINKCDKPDTNLERVKRELLSEGIQLEDFQGDVPCVCVSALKKTGLSELQEAILTMAELLELKGVPSGRVDGTVIESKTDTGRGKLATSLIHRGTLKTGMYLVAGTCWGKVRGIFNDSSKQVTEAPPATPVEISGWKELPSGGDEILQVESERRARQVVKYRQDKAMAVKMEADQLAIMDKTDEHLKWYKAELEKKRLQGRKRRVRPIWRDKESVEKTHPHLEVVIRGVVYAFNVKSPDSIYALARQKNVLIKNYNVIYKLIDDLREQLNSRLPLTDEEEILGEAHVLQEFLIKDGRKQVPVAGCRCTKGNLLKKHLFRVMRDEEVLHEGTIASLKHFKNEVDSIKNEMECGIMFDTSAVHFQSGDTILCYVVHKVPDTIDWITGF